MEIDILRGFLLVWMTLTHLPTLASNISNQTFGFVSGAEGFIFLSAFMVGQIQLRVERKRGKRAALYDIGKRTFRVYAYHAALLAIAFLLVAPVGVHLQREPLQNLLSYYLEDHKHAVIAAYLLQYRPSLLDILPLYVVFMLLTPIARQIADRWSWKVVLALSAPVWLAAQFGLRSWAYHHFNPFGLDVPENSIGAFDTFGWQFLWMAGLAAGATYANRIAREDAQPLAAGIPRWLLTTSAFVAAALLVLRYCPVDKWIDPNLYGVLIDKWRLAPVRIVDFSALAILIIKFGERIAAFPIFPPLADLGRASIEVFSVQVLCCLGAVALSHQADPNLPWWQQVLVLIVTMTALFLTAWAQKLWTSRRDSAKTV